MSDWQRTITDLQTLAETFADQGWTVISSPVGHVGVAEPDSDSERWGLIPIVPGDVADQITELVDIAAFDEGTVYKQHVAGHVYLVLQYRDHDRMRLIQIAGACEAETIQQLAEHAADTGAVPVHFRRLSGEYIASFTHDDWESFVVSPE